VSGQLHALAALPRGKSPWYPLDRRLGGPYCDSNPNPLAVQPVASCYTDWTILAPESKSKPWRKPARSRQQAKRAVLAWLTLWPWGWRQYLAPKHRWTSSGLHGITFQKIVLFINVKVCNKGVLLYWAISIILFWLMKHKVLEAVSGFIIRHKYEIWSVGITGYRFGDRH
jgi:hypothetical protein